MKKGQSPALLKNNLNVVESADDEPKTSRWFALVLYPEDARHELILQHLLRFPFIYKIVYILHDKDVYIDEDLKKEANKDKTVGELKKAHYHVLINYKTNTTASAVARKLCSPNLYVKVIHDCYSYLIYMLHEDIGSIEKGKFLYPVSDLRGDLKLISLLSHKNNNFVQLRELCELIKKFPDITYLVSFVADNPEYCVTFDKYEHLLVACVNQYLRLRSMKLND